MFDLNNNFKLFSVDIPTSHNSQNNILVISGSDCTIDNSKNQPHSEFEECNYYYFNENDYGHGTLLLDIMFNDCLKNPYFDFTMACLSIRTENGIVCKVNGEEQEPAHSKVTQDSKISVGLGYFFRSEAEKNEVISCNHFLVEAFIAIGSNQRNVYGLMCHLEKENDCWKLKNGNTYKIFKKANINHLKH